MSKILNKIFVFDPAWVYTFIQVGFIPKIKQCFNNIKIRLASRKKWIDFPYYFHKIQLKTFNTIYKINTYKVLQVGEMAYWLVTLDTKHNTVLSFLGFLFASNIPNWTLHPEISMVPTRKTPRKTYSLQQRNQERDRPLGQKLLDDN